MHNPPHTLTTQTAQEMPAADMQHTLSCGTRKPITKKGNKHTLAVATQAQPLTQAHRCQDPQPTKWHRLQHFEVPRPSYTHSQQSDAAASTLGNVQGVGRSSWLDLQAHATQPSLAPACTHTLYSTCRPTAKLAPQMRPPRARVGPLLHSTAHTADSTHAGAHAYIRTHTATHSLAATHTYTAGHNPHGPITPSDADTQPAKKSHFDADSWLCFRAAAWLAAHTR